MFRDHIDRLHRPLRKPGASLLLPVPVSSGRTGQEQSNRVTTAHPRLGFLAGESVVWEGAPPSVSRSDSWLELDLEVLERHLDIARQSW
uniref:Uncharacterized protein n=1 Tax=Peronospora matthiolae TaxID=2874970 RepID=A0AAV1TZ55_9STRA